MEAYEFTFSFTVRGSLTISLKHDDVNEAVATAKEALEAIALGDSIYPITDYTIDQKPDVYLEGQGKEGHAVH
jgi:hypothetical protein